MVFVYSYLMYKTCLRIPKIGLLSNVSDQKLIENPHERSYDLKSEENEKEKENESVLFKKHFECIRGAREESKENF